MKSKKYWEKRAAKDMVSAMNSAEVSSEELAEMYSAASQDLIFRINKLIDTYSDRWDLTEEEAEKLLNGAYDIEGLKKALRTAPDEEKTKIIKKLEGSAYGARIRRLEELDKQINELSKVLFLRSNANTTKLLTNLINTAYYRKIWGIQSQVGFQFSFTHIDKKMIDNILKANWSGANYSQRIWNNTNQLAQRVKKDILMSYLTGKPNEALAQQIAKDFSVSAYQSRRLLRTESAYVYEQASKKAYEEAGIEEYQILATLDTRTSKICQEMDGKRFPVGKEVTGTNSPPFHPFCRTTTKAVITGEVAQNLKRRARNPVTGKNELVPAETTYKEWAKQNGLKTDD